ncbi:hypothetical protein KI387_022400 [Taxus chinensis]|uniref:Uncharacterized protein n=1 Tax=Taxus chinensis TaxID=29808 RepID=A0AA38L4J6_TAXCH|nr:hypothetical protein KI387_022400 [Taxus chinensis]
MAVESSKWWTKESVAVVTGANKGIGFEIVRQLAENGFTVALTARDADRGLRATKTLNEEGFTNVVFRELDIQNPHSISDFASWLKDNYGALDILVNNAAILGSEKVKEIPTGALKHIPVDKFNDPILAKLSITNNEMSKNCFEINYYGTKRITEALLPLFRPEARIVNVSSEAGLLQWLRNDSLRQKLSDVSKITEEFIDEMIEGFLDDMKNGELEEKGWPLVGPQYCLSKLAVNAYTRLLSRKLSDGEGKKIYVNSVHPGIVQTDMTRHFGMLTASQGAESVVMLALLPPNGPSGQFFFIKEHSSF